jgi:hypothetical protein
MNTDIVEKQVKQTYTEYRDEIGRHYIQNHPFFPLFASVFIRCDKKLHHKLPCAAPSVWGNPTEICVSSNAGV